LAEVPVIHAAEPRIARLPPLPEVPLVSVFTLVYNHERFIARAIESVLSQDWPAEQLQYVVLDDGSSDRSAEIVESYSDHLTFIRQENQGINAAVNRAMQPLNGDVIMGVAGDDEWPEGRIRVQVDYLQRHPSASLCYGEVAVIDADGNLISPSLATYYKMPQPEGDVTSQLVVGNFINGGALAMRGCLKDAVWPIPTYAGWEDWWWAYRMSLAGEVGRIPALVYRYRRHDNNINLGVDSDAQVANMRAELPFRLWMIANTPRDRVRIDDLLRATHHIQWATAVWRELGNDPSDLFPTLTAADRERAERLLADARAALDLTLADAALLLAVRAFTVDPLTAGFEELANDGRALRAQRPAEESNVLVEGHRTLLVATTLQDLVDDPSLLAAYCDTFDEDADATLAVVSEQPVDETVQTLQSLLGSLLEDPEKCPDIQVLAGVSGTFWDRVKAASQATLTGTQTDGPGPLSVSTAVALRRVARLVWTSRETDEAIDQGLVC
jgi:glycosyltransferase involved in cell wall biosynthesis